METIKIKIMSLLRHRTVLFSYMETECFVGKFLNW